MKNITATIITLAMLAGLTACGGGNTNIIDGTTTGGASPSPTETTVTTTETTTVTEGTTLPPETTETTVPVMEEPFDADGFLADCTVYEVTVDTATAPLDELNKLDDADKPEKIALHFADAEGLTILMDSTESDYGNHYYVKHVFNDKIDVPMSSDKQFSYKYVGFGIGYKNGITIIEDGNGHGSYAIYYIIKDNEYYILKNDSSETECALSVYFNDDGGLGYTKTASKYHVNSIEALLLAYESDDDFYKEYGSVAFESGEMVFAPETKKTINEYSTYPANELCNKYGVQSIGELAKKYKQLVAEGRQLEFLELD